MDNPLLLFLTAMLLVLSLLVTALLMYHIYLILSNQTTNERYKLAMCKDANSRFYRKSCMENILDFLFPKL